MDKFKDLLIMKYQAKDDKQNFNDTEISDTINSEMKTDAVVATVIATG